MRISRACLIAVCSLAFLAWAALPCAAESPDYALPGRFAWPWSCGEGYRVTWGPEDHLYYGKARGVAYDFALPPGTPLYAPISGIAHFLLDERPFETNFGHYVEIVTLDGHWLIRLAHLATPQSGERSVTAGELIGYSGSSGVTAAHLHLELLLWDGDEWTRPEMARLDSFFGMSRSGLVEEAIIVQDQCEAQAAMNGRVHSLDGSVTLGESVQLMVPLRNEGLEQLEVETVQVLLRHEGGASWMIESAGPWRLAPKGEGLLLVSGVPARAGAWQVSHVTYSGVGMGGRLPAEGELVIEPLPLVAEALEMPEKILWVGAQLALDVSLRNLSNQQPLALEDLYVRGLRPDGTTWEAQLGTSLSLDARGTRSFRVRSSIVPQQVGLWEAREIGFRRDGRVFHLADVRYAFAVFGPELRIDNVHTFASHDALTVLLTVTNSGTAVARPDAMEVWGWRADGETPFTLSQARVAPIAPGGTALVLLSAPLADLVPGWRLVQAGQWLDGAYYPLTLAPQPSGQGSSAPAATP